MTDLKEYSTSKLIDHFTYWGEHPDYPEDDWKYQVADGNTKRGYWEWVVRQLEEKEEEGQE